MQATAFARVFLQRPSSPATSLPLPPSLAVPLPAPLLVFPADTNEATHSMTAAIGIVRGASSPSLQFSLFPSLSLVLFIANSFIRFVLLPVIFCGLIAVPKMKLATFEAPKCTEKRSEPRKNCTPHRNITRLRIELDRDTSEEGKLVDGDGGHGNWCLSIG